MLATLILALVLLLAAPPPATPVAPGVHVLEVGGAAREVVALSPQAARAYHILRGDGVLLRYRVVVLRGGPIDVYLMPAASYGDYAATGGGMYLEGFSQQGTTVLERTFADGAYPDTYLIVDNRAGTTGAAPAGDVTVEVLLTLEGGDGGRALEAASALGALLAAFAAVPLLVHRSIASARPPLPPPPRDDEGGRGEPPATVK